MHHRSIAVILSLVALLGLLFQYNRNDGFLRLLKNTNAAVITAGVKTDSGEAGMLDKDRYLLVYDPTNGDSLRLRANLEKTLRQLKKEVKVISSREAVAEQDLNYRGILVTAPNWDTLKSLEAFRSYARQGGKVYFLHAPFPGTLFRSLAQEVGITTVGNLEPTTGVTLLSNVLIGGEGFSLDSPIFKNMSLTGTLAGTARVHMVSLQGTPLLWEQNYGQGTYIVYNGTNLFDKENRGVITGILGIAQKYYVYPVIGIKTVCIDDFPAPVPEGYNEKITAEYQLSTPEFFRQVWWPDMLSSAQKYDIKYTGLIIETYNDQVTPPFAPEENNGANRTNLIVYGRELLKSGGELGVHGYNHQALVLTGQATNESYNTWPDKQAMADSVAEVKRYIEAVYPGYKLKVYVPPSNILSPEGRQVVREQLPDLKVIASISSGNGLGDGSYLQEYSRNPDGILEMPRLSVDYSRHAAHDWNILNGITYLGVFSHFVHPDNIFYSENVTKTWREMHAGFESLLKMLKEKFGWLRSSTMSQGAEYFEDYLNLDYRVVEEQSGFRLLSWGFREEAYFILRTPQKIKSAQGCRAEIIGPNLYLLKISGNQASITFESEAKQQ